MHDPLAKLGETALRKADKFLQDEGFSPTNERTFGENYSAIWERKVELDNVSRNLIIKCSNEFPGDLPDFFLEPFDDLLFRVPHIDSDGKICVIPDHVLVDRNQIEEVLKFLIGNVLKILNEPEFSDFDDEFDSYWILAENAYRQTVHLISHPSKYCEEAVACLTDNNVFLAADETTVTNWVGKMTGKKPQRSQIHQAIVHRTRTVIRPENFPKTARDVRELLKSNQTVLQKLDDHYLAGAKLLFLLLIQSSHDGAVFGAVAIRTLKLGSKREVLSGFRAGKIPKKLGLARGKSILKKSKVDLLRVKRVDHEWIHTRGGAGSELEGKNVTIIGAGSLGGYVAHLMARAGVSKIDLIDPDNMSWDNVGRHVLGGGDVGLNKAKALKQRLEHDMPHLSIHGHSDGWKAVFKENPKILGESNLVISTVASWRVEHDLNYLNRKIGNFPPVIFGWLEPFGVAGHCIAVLPIGGCFGCGMNSSGAFQFPAAEFASVTTRPEPGGCGVFQQYGPTSMMPIASMVAECATAALLGKVERSEFWSWIGKEEILVDNSGRWSSRVNQLIGKGGTEKMYKEKWTRNNNCKLCA
jgi:molybdopterin/thiamine biosynthesis adenylyltransferase